MCRGSEQYIVLQRKRVADLRLLVSIAKFQPTIPREANISAGKSRDSTETMYRAYVQLHVLYKVVN